MRSAESSTDSRDRPNAVKPGRRAVQAEGSRPSKLTAEVCQGDRVDSENGDRECREAIIDYFSILREWDLKLRLNESDDTPKLGRP